MHSLTEAPHQFRDIFFVGAARRKIQQLAVSFYDDQDGSLPYAKYFIKSMTSSVCEPIIAQTFWELPQREFFHALTHMLTGGKQIKVR